MSDTPRKDSRDGRGETLFWRLAPLAYAVSAAVIILSLPLFPNQDGPVHLYYVDVLRGLLTHTGPYLQHFQIKSYLTPYALEYYSLLLLETVFSPLVSEKLLVCCYVFAFVLSFRYLTASVTDTPGPWTLAGALVSLNCYVYLGLLNFAFGTALALLLCGAWLRWMRRLTPLRIVLLCAEFILIMFTHPLPLAIFLGFAGLHVFVSFGFDRWHGAGLLKAARMYRRGVVVLGAMGVSAVLWVLHFTGSSHPSLTSPPALREPFFRTLSAELKFWTLAPLSSAAYRTLLIAAAVAAGVALLIALRQTRGRLGPAGISSAALVVICLLARCLAPEAMNGSHFFHERFSLFWVMFLFLVAAAAKPSRWCVTAVGIVALAVAASTLYLQWEYLSVTAHDMAAALDAPAAKSGSLGIIVAERRSILASDPFHWGSAHYFRKSQAILTNAPWMDLEIIMLQPKHLYPWSYSEPDIAAHQLSDTVHAAGSVPLDFVVRVHQEGPITWDAIQPLGLSSMKATPQLEFYARPGRIGPESH